MRGGASPFIHTPFGLRQKESTDHAAFADDRASDTTHTCAVVTSRTKLAICEFRGTVSYPFGAQPTVA